MEKLPRIRLMHIPVTGRRRALTRIASLTGQHRQLFRFLCVATVCLIPLAHTIGQERTSVGTIALVPPATSPSLELPGNPRLDIGRRDSASDLLDAERAAIRRIESDDVDLRPTKNRITDAPDVRHRERQAATRKMGEKLKQLKMLLDQRQKASDEAKLKAQQEPEPPVPGPEEGETAVAVTQGADPATNQPPANDVAGVTVPTPPPASANDSVFADSLSADAIVDGPVDRIGLADSLYALDELTIAWKCTARWI
ncbi:MAG: hypothetical protein GY903_34280 [Fuerstiella sp.]|nr:hypothetical protein [Fuerstiella sp.]MCP4859560.1 hypothetical protein [Fuerstiella sp.]